MNTMGRNDFLHYTTMVSAKNNTLVSGDRLKAILSETEFTAVLVDGLGSGAGARASATIVIEELEKAPTVKLDALLEKSNARMIGMRGAVAAAIRIKFKRKIIEFSSIGNISCYIFRQQTKKIIYPRQMMGYLSGNPQHFTIQALEYESGDFFFLHSDGLEINEKKALLIEEEFIRVQSARSNYIHFHNDDASFIAGRLF